jgi:hypothetical protein
MVVNTIYYNLQKVFYHGKPWDVGSSTFKDVEWTKWSCKLYLEGKVLLDVPQNV